MRGHIAAGALIGLTCLSAKICPRAFAQDSAPPATPPGPEPAVAVATPTTAEPSATSEKPESSRVKSVRFTGTLGVISLPRLLSIELLARFRKTTDPEWDLFAVGAGIEYLPPGLASFGEFTTLSWLQVGPEARFFVWRFLFAGLRLGYQFSRADSENFGSEVDYVTTSFFVAPKIGALYTLKSGLTLGADLGATIPLFPDTTRDSDGTTDSNARKVAKTFGMFVMPFLSLRVGWTI